MPVTVRARGGWVALAALALACLGPPAARCQDLPALPVHPGNLEGEWRVRLDPEERGEAEGWADPDLDDSQWETRAVPGYIDGPDGHPDYDGCVWYRLRFRLPLDWAGQALVLSFGSVDDHDRTYVNGTRVGETGPGVEIPSLAPRRYAVGPELLRPDASNVIAVRVRDLGGPGGLHRGPLTLLPAAEIERRRTVTVDAGRPLAERFDRPPADCRILKIIHGFPKDPATHEGFLDDLLLQGFGGIVCNVHFDEYLESEPLWQSFLHGVEQAQARGMTMWLYDEQGYPSGNAGELVLRDHPEWQARGVLAPGVDTAGEAVALTLPEGAVISAVAVRRSGEGITLEGSVDLTAAVAGGTLRWQPPAGSGAWRVLAFVEAPVYEGTHAAMNVYVHRPYVNLMERAATDRFLELTHREYARRIPGIGRVFQSTFTDEPSLMTAWLSPMPYPALPWSMDFRESFRAKRGYDIVPLLPALIEDAGAEGHRARCDFWEHVADLTASNFFAPIRDWCHGNGVPSGGHLLMEESLAGHVGFYGDFYRCAEQLDYPGIDCLTSEPGGVPWYIAKLLGSVAHLHGAPKVMSETSDHVQRYRPEGDTRPVVPITAEQIRGTCNRLYVGGVNVTTSYYSFAGLNTVQMNELNEYVGRIGTVLTDGKAVTDIGLLYPIETLWAHHRPARSGPTASERARQVERGWMDAQNRLFAARRDYEIVPSHAIAEATVDAGRLRTGGLELRCLVLAATDTLPVEATRKALDLWRSGGAVVFVGALPTHTPEALSDPAAVSEIRGLFPTIDGQEIATATSPAGGLAVYLPPGMEPLFADVLRSTLEPDLTTAEESPIRYAHREVEGRQVYFLINDSPQPVEADCTFAATGPAEWWDPMAGTRSPLATTAGDRASSAPVRLGGYGSAFVVFPQAAERRVLAGGAVAARLTATPLAEVLGAEPTWTAGGGAAGEISSEAISIDRDGVALPCLRASTLLRETGVDSWCFAQAQLPAGALRGLLGLRAAIWAPTGQESCSAHLYAIATVDDGGQFIADLPTGLAKPGWSDVPIWFESFTPTGWKPTRHVVLDPATITGLSIGWGGYTAGTAGDRIVFGLGPLAAVGKGTDR